MKTLYDVLGVAAVIALIAGIIVGPLILRDRIKLWLQMRRKAVKHKETVERHGTTTITTRTTDITFLADAPCVSCSARPDQRITFTTEKLAWGGTKTESLSDLPCCSGCKSNYVFHQKIMILQVIRGCSFVTWCLHSHIYPQWRYSWCPYV
jgi:hypothetical protein